MIGSMELDVSNTSPNGNSVNSLDATPESKSRPKPARSTKRVHKYAVHPYLNQKRKHIDARFARVQTENHQHRKINL